MKEESNLYIAFIPEVGDYEDYFKNKDALIINENNQIKFQKENRLVIF
jgi:hypothetical protein